ncbi:hypothetical protein HPB49_012940 [Dermacentor silvarum]|uniref:Uncharacterized protein n=1 Tax=Dermacentor silvarum TaxID=543639 RepID=A0ACB8DDP2_DERSI|nr:hypothetical protein HPB49_012940 [Dermacentor silvarum]
MRAFAAASADADGGQTSIVAPELVQKRWKSLRDTFRRYFSGHMQSQTSGSDDVQSVDTDWPLFELFLFLNDRMVTRPIPSIVTSLGVIPGTSLNVVNSANSRCLKSTGS